MRLQFAKSFRTSFSAGKAKRFDFKYFAVLSRLTQINGRLITQTDNWCTTSISSIERGVRILCTVPSPEYTIINMPALSPTMEAGSITKWNKQPGESLTSGDILCEVATDKATVSFEMQEEGVLAKILVPVGSSEVKVGTPIALSVEDIESYHAFQKADADGNVATGGTNKEDNLIVKNIKGLSEKIDNATSTGTDFSTVREFLLSPAAKHMTRNMGVDVSELKGSGKSGRITKSDIILALNNGVQFKKLTDISNFQTDEKKPSEIRTSASPVLSKQLLSSAVCDKKIPTESSKEEPVYLGEYDDVPANNIRKVIAKRLTQSKASVPHMYLSIECEIDAVLQLRKVLSTDYNTKVSVNDVVIRAAAMALRDVPEANSKWSEINKRVIASNSIDISVAVATPTGLITPIITRVDERGFSNISEAVRELAGRAKKNKLLPEEFQGGTFTISNLGMFGTSEFSAVINIPQACILAVGTGSRKVIPGDIDSETGSRNCPRVATLMSATLSCDRRVLDEAKASQFMKVFQFYLQKPTLMML